jgi:hypothetical protein
MNVYVLFITQKNLKKAVKLCEQMRQKPFEERELFLHEEPLYVACDITGNNRLDAVKHLQQYLLIKERFEQTTKFNQMVFDYLSKNLRFDFGTDWNNRPYLQVMLFNPNKGVDEVIWSS